MAERKRYDIYILIFSSIFMPCFAKDNEEPISRAPSLWSWEEECHVLRSHPMSTFGTSGSLLGIYDQQGFLNGSLGGKNRGSYTYITTINQNLWYDSSFIIYAEGGHGKGITPLTGSLFNTNAVAGEPECILVSRAFLLSPFWDKKAQLVAGKITLSDFFDTNAVANCEIRQFLAGSMVNNPIIPFPDYGIGAALNLVSEQGHYLHIGIGDANAKGTTFGLESALGGNSDFFSIYELGLIPRFRDRKGTYRFIYWRNPSVETNQVTKSSSGSNQGLALSFDQQLSDRVDLFSRYGYAEHPVANMRQFWSAGMRLMDPFENRKDDFREAGFALGNSENDSEKSQTLFETDYSAQITPDITITPLLQMIWNAQGRTDVSPVIIGGIRAVLVY